MNKKQAIIIVTLLALIICAGMLATKVNDPLVGTNDEAGDKSTLSLNSSQTTSEQSNFFTENRIIKEQQTSVTLQNLKSLIDDENVDKEQKSKIIEEFNNISTNADKESDIEIALKGKGFEDSLCMIEDNNKVRVIVKSEGELTTKQVKEIQDVVMSITSLSDVEIETKQ